MKNLFSQIKSSGIVAGFLMILSGSMLQSCYSFTGNSLSEDVKTIQIKDFINTASRVNPSLAQQFTIDINKRFLQRTTLKGTNENPHILIEGEISNYDITPTTISSGVNAPGGVIQAAQNKLTITVKVHYENAIQPEKSFDRTYTDESTFSSDLDINAIEASQVSVVNERIINKIFNDIIADW